MWWYFEKLGETETTILYAYGFESKKTTGQLEYDKANKKAKILKYADNHDEATDIQYTAYQLVSEYGNLDKKMIAYGFDLLRIFSDAPIAFLARPGGFFQGICVARKKPRRAI